MMYIKPFPSGISASMTLDALSRLNSYGADHEMSVINEIMVSVRCFLKPEMSDILVPNVFYDLYNKNGSPVTDLTVCLNYDRRYLMFYVYGHILLDIDYQDGSHFVYPEWRKPGTIKELSLDIFGDSDFLG